MKITLEASVGHVAPAALDHLLTHVASILERGSDLKFNIKVDGKIARLANKSKLLRKIASRAASVAYDASESGYSIVVLDRNNDIIDEFNGGNHPQDSQASLPSEAGGAGYDTNLGLAQEMAQKKALEVSGIKVWHEPELLASERINSNQHVGADSQMPEPQPINPEEVDDLQNEMPGRVVTPGRVPRIRREQGIQRTIKEMEDGKRV